MLIDILAEYQKVVYDTVLVRLVSTHLILLSYSDGETKLAEKKYRKIDSWLHISEKTRIAATTARDNSLETYELCTKS